MTLVTLDPADPAAAGDIIARAGRALRDGWLVALPTETVYGSAPTRPMATRWPVSSNARGGRGSIRSSSMFPILKRPPRSSRSTISR